MNPPRLGVLFSATQKCRLPQKPMSDLECHWDARILSFQLISHGEMPQIVGQTFSGFGPAGHDIFYDIPEEMFSQSDMYVFFDLLGTEHFSIVMTSYSILLHVQGRAGNLMRQRQVPEAFSDLRVSRYLRGKYYRLADCTLPMLWHISQQHKWLVNTEAWSSGRLVRSFLILLNVAVWCSCHDHCVSFWRSWYSGPVTSL